MFFSKLAVFFLILMLLTFAWWYFGMQRAGKQSVSPEIGGEVVVMTTAGEVTVPVELAQTSAERIQGLSDRESLPENSGMLFMWNMNVRSMFSMRRMRFPLDIIFIRGTDAGEGEIISISADLPPCPNKDTGCATASAPEAFQYVLEVDGGFAETHGIDIGDTVSIQSTQ